ncbi:MAG: ABC transporter ATP-binding protein [Halobacteria archaeon]
MTVIELDNVVKAYRRGDSVLRALKNANFQLEKGEFVTIMGPSGSGKSTLLNMMGLLDEPTKGEVHLKGREVTNLSEQGRTQLRRKLIGFVFQDFHLIPTMTAKENVMLPARFTDLEKRKAKKRAIQLLRLVGLGDRMEHTPDELSGGQQQRVAIARSMINSPSILLSDEPTGNLDTQTGKQIVNRISSLCDRGISIVAVTHDEFVTHYSDRTVLLVDGKTHTEGTLEEIQEREARESEEDE